MKKTIIFGTGQENEKSKFNEKKFLQIINFCIDSNVQLLILQILFKW